MVKGLNDLLPRHHLFNVSVHGCNGFADGQSSFRSFADEFDCKKHNKPHNNNDCKQRNGKNEHHCNDADEDMQEIISCVMLWCRSSRIASISFV